MLIAEDLLLLLYDDETGKPLTGSAELECALAGAVVIELIRLGRLDLAESGEDVKEDRLEVLDAGLTGNPILDERLRLLGDKQGKRLRGLIPKLAKDLPEQVRDGLAERGVLSKERGRVLGLFPVTRWPAKDAQHESELRVQLEGVLIQDKEPDQRTGALIALLSAVDAVPKVLRQVADKRSLKRQARDIAESDRVTEEVVQEVKAALLTAAVVDEMIESTLQGGG
jgi:hypothetical protein